jgi:hypothetical protein
MNLKRLLFLGFLVILMVRLWKQVLSEQLALLLLVEQWFV